MQLEKQNIIDRKVEKKMRAAQYLERKKQTMLGFKNYKDQKLLSVQNKIQTSNNKAQKKFR